MAENQSASLNSKIQHYPSPAAIKTGHSDNTRQEPKCQSRTIGQWRTVPHHDRKMFSVTESQTIEPKWLNGIVCSQRVSQ